MLLLCVIVTLLSVTNAVVSDREYFQSEEVTFKCEHGKTSSELFSVEWKIGTQTCALMYIENGQKNYNCEFESRTTNFDLTSITLSKMKSFDDGEFSCIVTLTDEITTIEVTSFNVTVKVRPNNQRLLVKDKSYTCTDEVPVDTTSNDDVILTCSVESKPEASFTWSTIPALNGSLSKSMECIQDKNSLVYTCNNTLTLPSDKVTQKVVVTCHTEAADNMTDICVTLVSLLCNATSCLNGGSCGNKGCVCPENWWGDRCEEECDLISTPPETYNVTLGGNHTFTCNSSAPVTWRRDGEPLSQGNTLTLTNVHQKQAGYYYCNSSTPTCSQAVRFNLKVLHHWEGGLGVDGLGLEEVKVEIGSSKTINCSVTGKPLPSVQWSRLTDGNYSKLDNASNGYSLLKFDRFEEADAGKYICSASYLDVESNWTISVKVDGESSGLATWAVVVIVVLAAILLGIVILAILLKLLFAKVAETAIGPFESKTSLIVVGLLVVILLPGVGLVLVVSYYLVKVTGPSHGAENGKQVERKPSTATASKVYPEHMTSEQQELTNNGSKGGTITPPTSNPALTAVSGAQLAHSATVTQTHGGAPMKLEPLGPMENSAVDGPEKKKKKKKKQKKHRQEKDVENEGEDVTAETKLVSGDGEET